jgi:DNA-binding NtrC family response regulator
MNHTVLLVDDDVNLLEGLSRSLSNEPYLVLTASSAKAAIDALATTLVDVVLSDYDMPGMNGFDLLVHVRKAYPGIARFMLTGKPTLELAYDAVNEGAIDQFFLKPCKKPELALAIRKALNLLRRKG